MILFLVWMMCLKYVTCSNDRTTHVHGGNRLLHRHPRALDTWSESPFGNALYFHGKGEMLKLKSLQNDEVLPDEIFTLQFWIKPEGGQYRRTPIVGMDLFYPEPLF